MFTFNSGKGVRNPFFSVKEIISDKSWWFQLQVDADDIDDIPSDSNYWPNKVYANADLLRPIAISLPHSKERHLLRRDGSNDVYIFGSIYEKRLLKVKLAIK